MLLTLVVLVYETVGGMRAVAWTDTVQGVMLAGGLIGLLLAASPTPTHLAEVTTWISVEAPEKVAPPGWAVVRNWFSTLALIGFSGAVYPQAIQRIYAARDAAALKRSFSVMVFLPLVTTGSIFLIGILAIEQLAEYGPIEADQVLPLLLTVWGEQLAAPVCAQPAGRRGSRQCDHVDCRLGAVEPVLDAGQGCPRYHGAARGRRSAAHPNRQEGLVGVWSRGSWASP